ncbi:MAG: phosphatase PAP2 family protein [Chitinophagaceae bacterium]
MKQTFISIYLFLLTGWGFAQTDHLQRPGCAQAFIHKKDTLFFERTPVLKNLASVPADMWAMAKSPFQGNNWIGLGAVAVSTAVLIPEDQKIINGVRKISDKIGLHPETDYKVIWKSGTTKILKLPLNLNTGLYQAGEGGTSMLFAGGLWIYGKITNDRRAISTAADLAETFVTMGVTTQLLKRLTGRESPFLETKPGGRWKPLPAFNEYQRNTSAYDGFPSGHLATLMATVTVLSEDYPEKKWIRPVGYTLMCLSSWAMMNTEVHWAGDYPLAIALGYLSGKITTWRHRKHSKPVSEFILL